LLFEFRNVMSVFYKYMLINARQKSCLTRPKPRKKKLSELFQSDAKTKNFKRPALIKNISPKIIYYNLSQLVVTHTYNKIINYI